MTKPSRHSSVASAFFRATPLRLVLPALALVGAVGLFVSGCGDDSPTTPTPAPTPTPTPPTPPAPPEVPAGLAVASVGPEHIEWTWTAVEGAASYDIQMTLRENDFSQSQLRNIVAPATSARFTVAAETQAWARVRAKTADAESDYSDAVPGTSEKMPLVLTAPTGLREGDTGPRFIEWTWNVVAGATAYEVQVRPNDANFAQSDRIHNVPATAAPKFNHTVEPETSHYARVRAVAGTGADRVEGPWALAVEGESDQQPLGVPTGLEITATGQDFIEASWEAVEGATGYDAQLDVTSPYTFNPPSSTIEATRTSQRFGNLNSGLTVHVRVRARIGTRRGAWSSSVSGETQEPPVLPLATPANLTATSPTRSQVSLNWNDVTDAETYLVQQRVGSSGNWGNATCEESDDNEVDESECTVTGLDSGTEYQFRVRAVPVNDDDDRLRESAWSSSASATTTGRATTGGGGAGELNITWRSDADSITWRWDQAGPGVDFEYKVLRNVLDTAAPCDTRSQDWDGMPTFQTSHEVDGLNASDHRLLCVRSKTVSGGDTTYGDPSWSWAATTPVTPTAAGTAALFSDGEDGTAGGVTETLVWTTNFASQPEFTYEIRYQVDESEKTNDDFEPPDDADAAQLRCSGLDLEETIEPTGANVTSFRSSINLEPYAEYRMCYRAVNDNGASTWAHSFANDQEIYTRPAPPTVRGGTNRPHTTNTGATAPSPGPYFGFAWAVTTNQNAEKADTVANDLRADYEIIAADTVGDSAVSAERVAAACQATAAAGSTQVTNGVRASAYNASVSHVDPPESQGTRFDFVQTWLANDAATTKYYYLCVRANDVARNGSTRGRGPSPWVVSPGVSYKR